MNCLELRQQLLANPTTRDDAIRQHLQGCDECRRFADGLAEFELTLRQTTEVAVPEGLASRILLRQRLATRQHRRHYQWLSVAAGLVLAVAVAFYQFGDRGVRPLGETVLAHIHQELHHLDDRKHVDQAQLNELLNPLGAKLQRITNEVHYAGTCPIRRSAGGHVVLQSSTGPVTLLLMPGEFVEQRQNIKDKRFQGVIIPTRNGSMAIVGETPQQVEELEHQLKDNLLFLSSQTDAERDEGEALSGTG